MIKLNCISAVPSCRAQASSRVPCWNKFNFVVNHLGQQSGNARHWSVYHITDSVRIRVCVVGWWWYGGMKKPVNNWYHTASSHRSINIKQTVNASPRTPRQHQHCSGSGTVNVLNENKMATPILPVNLGQNLIFVLDISIWWGSANTSLCEDQTRQGMAVW